MKNNTPLSIGFSPCPNDTFIFDALIHYKIDTEGISFKPELADVESLNRRAFSAELDITKLSFFAYAFLSSEYQLLDSGAALGRGVGPLLISKKKFINPGKEIKTVAIPGKHTTANFLFSLFYPHIKIKQEMVFSEIEDAVLSGQVDAGVIIHENRFTYEDKGLCKITDLGSQWESETGKSIPLGGIAIRRALDNKLKIKVNTLLKQSVEFAMANTDASKQYVKSHSQELDDDVIQKHINLYVNDSSIDLGKNGRDAVLTLYEKAQSMSLIGSLTEPIFLKTKELQFKA